MNPAEQSAIIIELLKIALAVVAFLLTSLVAIVGWFLRRHAASADEMRKTLEAMRLDYVTVKATVDSVEKRVNGISDDYGPKILTLTTGSAVMARDLERLEQRVGRLEGFPTPVDRRLAAPEEDAP